MQLPSLNTPKIPRTEKGGGRGEKQAPCKTPSGSFLVCLGTLVFSCFPQDPGTQAMSLKCGKAWFQSSKENIHSHVAIAAQYLWGPSEGKPGRIQASSLGVILQEATSLFPQGSINPRPPLTGCLPPNPRFPLGERKKILLPLKRYQSSLVFQGSPALLTCPGPCPP